MEGLRPREHLDDAGYLDDAALVFSSDHGEADDPTHLSAATTRGGSACPPRTLAILALLAVGCDAGADPDHDRPPTVPILEVPILEGPAPTRQGLGSGSRPRKRGNSIQPGHFIEG